MDKKATIKAGLIFGFAMTIFFILQSLLTHDHLTTKNIFITIVSALFGGALGGKRIIPPLHWRGRFKLWWAAT